MQFEQYVAEGRAALADETKSARRLMELAGGVEREHGALAKWALEVGISQDRAEKLKKAHRVNEQIRGDAEMPPSVAVELAAVPDKQLQKAYEKAIEITAEDRGLPVEEIAAPSQRAARKAAEPFRTKKQPKPQPKHKQEEQMVLDLNEMRNKAVSLRDAATLGFTPSTSTVRDDMLRTTEQILKALEDFASAVVKADVEAVIS